MLDPVTWIFLGRAVLKIAKVAFRGDENPTVEADPSDQISPSDLSSTDLASGDGDDAFSDIVDTINSLFG